MKTHSYERSLFELQNRYERLSKVLSWDAEYRLIGRTLLLQDKPASKHKLMKATDLSKPTLYRRMAVMEENGLIQKTADGWEHTKEGRLLHIWSHRQIVAVASGKQDGVSEEYANYLASFPDGYRPNIRLARQASFPQDLPEQVCVSLK